MTDVRPRLIVFSSLFPNQAQPHAGLFIRERMFRVGKVLPLVVVSPKPWFPGQGLIRLFHPGYRLSPERREDQQGVDVFFPRFFSLPKFLRSLDGWFMALGSYRTVRRLKGQGFNIIDAHFGYPDGYAAVKLARWLDLPVSVTLRGTEVPQSREPKSRRRLQTVFSAADAVVAVADSLRRLAVELGLPETRGRVVGNGVDIVRFRAESRDIARERLGLSPEAKVLITVGGLVERKGFHRVIECIPQLLAEDIDLHYLIVGGASPEGNMREALEQQVRELDLETRVHFLGPVKPDELTFPLSAADIFVLSTRNEGWANVILEAMACGLPVVATDVGGNREIIRSQDLGVIVPFGDHGALVDALARAIAKTWDRERIAGYARGNSWDLRIPVLVEMFQRLANREAPWE